MFNHESDSLIEALDLGDKKKSFDELLDILSKAMVVGLSGGKLDLSEREKALVIFYACQVAEPLEILTWSFNTTKASMAIEAATHSCTQDTLLNMIGAVGTALLKNGEKDEESEE